MPFNIKQLKVYFIAGSQNTNHNVQKLLEIVEKACANGITMFQYREKDESTLNADEILNVAKKIKKITDYYRVPLIIDDNLTLAKSINADGIHVGQDDESINQIRNEIPNKIIGLSVHNETELLNIKNNKVNYLGIGPIYHTSSKANPKKAIGIDKLNRLATISKFPTVAIGGIHAKNINTVLYTPVNGIAVISEIIDSDNIEKTINKIRGLKNG
ncbi:thiamine phosphate synthase [Apilactobacillus quenuiae]|uniref:thiamine phosphate synthase n=1 Tax=Apilactobacillus quenuiae TaxID=2008377 RepID=UPI000D0220FC|nr:thiamine phosphate synthase [Apilactobacillus quenuiae]